MPIAAAMRTANVVIAAASRSMYHIEAKNAAKLAGARGVFNAPYNEDGWINGAMTADFLEIRKTAERLRDRLARGKIAHVTSPAGTDVLMVIENRKPVGWLTGVCRNPGEVSAFPGGEVSLPPLEGTTQGPHRDRAHHDRYRPPARSRSPGSSRRVDAVRFEGGVEARALEQHIAGRGERHQHRRARHWAQSEVAAHRRDHRGEEAARHRAYGTRRFRRRLWRRGDQRCASRRYDHERRASRSTAR